MNKKIAYVLCITLSACILSNNEAEMLKEAQIAFDARELNTANSLAKKVLKNNNASAHARFLMAEIAILQGRINAAEIDYRRAYTAGFDRTKILPPFIAVLAQQQKHHEIPALVTDLPASFDIQKAYWMGLFFLGNKHYDEADTAFSKSLHLSQMQYANGFFGKALIQSAQKNDHAALMLLDDALILEPDHIHALLMKAEIFINQQQDYKALPILLSMTHKQSDSVTSAIDAKILSMLIHIYWRQHNAALAEKHTKTLRSRYKKKSISHYHGALVSFRQGGYDQAINLLHKSLQKTPDDSALLALMGSIKYHQGFYEQADFYMHSALVNEPEHSQLTTLLAAARLQDNKATDAIDLLEQKNARQTDPFVLWLLKKTASTDKNTSKQ